jgi:hypothetical protein
MPSAPPRPRILKATAIATVVALLILATTILPAEYGIDPLGTGRMLGLTALSGVTDATTPGSNASTAAPAREASSTYNEDVYTVELRPFEGVEYKYRLEQGAGLVYSWEATAKVKFEFHGEPDGAPAKYFDSYSKGESGAAQGGFTATKPGIHGWFWENLGATRVTVTLRTAGFYSKSTEYRDGERVERQFPSAASNR